MSLNPRFSRYLEHFGKTVPTREFAASPRKRHLTALRHDIDYDLDVALELAYWEYKAGLRATYFVLHTTDYYRNDGALIDKCLQLQDFGHEVGLHTNFLAEWYRQEIDDPRAALEVELDRLRSGGVELVGVTAHGDALCYDAGFTNYWMFEDIRPENPAKDEHRVTAEGTSARDVDRTISYPEDSDALVRPDGKRFPYWSLKLSDFGLAYEASRLNPDSYFSDSGGVWKRTPDPLTHTFGKDRSLVLMHPIYWKGEQRHFYFLSTARSGSSWLANFLDKATPVTARHEFTLNHEFEAGNPKAHKRTAAGFTDLVADKGEASRLIVAARSWSEGLQTDFAEANIYLEQFLDLLPRGPDTQLIHLHRDPRDVVRSLLQRGWYGVPHDDRHSRIEVDGWDSMSQLEQVCWYIRDVNERLQEACGSQLAFEDMVHDLPVLSEQLERLGIPVFPRLAKELFAKRVNATAEWDVGGFDSWPEEEKEVFERICGETCCSRNPDSARNRSKAPKRKPQKPGKSIETAANAEVLLETLFDPAVLSQPGGVSLVRCMPTEGGNGRQFTFASGVGGYLLLGGGFWSPAKELSPALQELRHQELVWPLTCWCGWLLEKNSVYLLDIGLEIQDSPASLRVMCLSYDDRGRLIARQDIGTLSPEWPSFTRYFRPRRQATSFNVALFKGPDEEGCTVELTKCRLVRCFENRMQLGAPEEVSSQAPNPVRFRSAFLDAKPIEAKFSIRRLRKNLRIPMLRFDLIDEKAQIAGFQEETKEPIWRNLGGYLKNGTKSLFGDTGELRHDYAIADSQIVCGCITVDSPPKGVSYVVLGVPEQQGKLMVKEGGFRLGSILPDQRTTHFRARLPDGADALEIHIVRYEISSAPVKVLSKLRLVDSGSGVGDRMHGETSVDAG